MLRRPVLALLAATTIVGGLSVAPAVADGEGSGGADVTELPIGDDPVSSPEVGKIFSCQTNFNSNAPGAFNTGDWINDDGTWDLTKKPTVDGEVVWPDAEITITTKGSSRIISGNGLPVEDPTGTFPVASSDDAYDYDRNPNSISAQTVTITLPKKPKVADEPSCTSLGTIGIFTNGVQLFNALDAGGRDAKAYEIQDSCDGHPEMSGSYHYHSASSCVIADLDSGSGHSALVGYAADGFGIYGTRGTNGEDLNNSDLDECHGHTHKVKFNAKLQKIYHYHATAEYPYTIGCYRGTPVSTNG